MIRKPGHHRSRKPGARPMEAVEGLELSVIMPMEDHRGMGLRAVESWTLEQQCDPGSFELIVLIDSTTDRLKNDLKRRLRPHDRIVYAGAENEMAQVHRGALQACSSVLFFTEPHCIAEPQLAAALINFFKDRSADGLCVRSTPLAKNRIAEMEARMYDEGFAQWSKPNHWAKVILRGFGIRRAAYDAVGGFNSRYSRFSEWLLAATLHQHGVRLRYAPEAGLAHQYSDNFALLERFIREFTRGECLYRMETNDAHFCIRYFGNPLEWTEGRMFRPALARTAWSHLRRLVLRRGSTAQSLRGTVDRLRLVRHAAPRALLGKSGLLWSYRLRVILSKILFYLSFTNRSRQYRSFVDWYMGVTELCRLEMALTTVNRRQGGQTADSKVLRLAELTEEDLYGFYPAEHYEGSSFRWSRPTAAVRLALKPVDCRLTLHMLSVRKINPRKDTFFFLNGHRFDDASAVHDGSALRLRLRAAYFNAGDPWLIIMCPPWHRLRRSRRDRRELGMPLKKISITVD